MDAERRRAAIADALFGVLRDAGLSKVTLANVADRAGLAIGSVRHFLGTREEMMAFAFDAVSDRFRDRILARAQALLADHRYIEEDLARHQISVPCCIFSVT